MKIILTGGGTGGHFYPTIAVAEQINEISRNEKLIGVKLYYIASTPFDKRVLFDNQIEYRKNYAGKIRGYFSIMNFFDLFKTGWGIIKSIMEVFTIYPDVIFGKGGFDSFPVLVAGRLFGIPIMIHESDTVPGKVNKWAGKFAKKIAISYPETLKFFPEDKVALTGNPIRQSIINPSKNAGFDFFQLDSNIKTILVIGGSQGSSLINEAILDTLPELVSKYQIIHQTGPLNFKEISETATLILKGSQFENRYKPLPYLNDLQMNMSAGIANLVITRAGSALFEISAWEIPAIIIPIQESNGDHQRRNALTYASSGAANIIEEKNLSKHILINEAERILENETLSLKMKRCAKTFSKTDAAKIVARELINIALKHEE